MLAIVPLAILVLAVVAGRKEASQPVTVCPDLRHKDGVCTPFPERFLHTVTAIEIVEFEYPRS